MSKGLSFSAARALARWRGLKRYTGAPCKRCGSQRKYVGNASCVDCERIKAADPANRGHANLYQRERRKRIPPTPEQRAKDVARSRANHARKRGRPDVVNAANKRAAEQAAVRLNTLIALREAGVLL